MSFLKPTVEHGLSSESALDIANRSQRAASDPMTSAWVGASAGSGKTKVLTDRFLRLLLPQADGRPGAHPEKILAITFTKAGASEMALRLTQRLSRWTVMTEAALATDLEKSVLGYAPTPAQKQRARTLFATVADSPNGLRIMTIHSFCQSILGRFPLEAGISPNFKPLEEDEAQNFLRTALDRILLDAHTEVTSPLANAVRTLAVRFQNDDLYTMITSMVNERRQLEDILQRTFNSEGFYTALCNAMDILPGTTEENLLRTFIESQEERDLEDLRTCARVLLEGGTTDQKSGSVMALYLAADIQDRPRLYPSYKKAFLTLTGDRKSKFANKNSVEKCPLLPDIMGTECARIEALEELFKRVRTVDIMSALVRVTETVLKTYDSLKAEKGALDFNDLILKTLALLKGDTYPDLRSNITPSSWVLYKMDSGLDHILLDEAQDTNPEQWEIVRLLCEEFFTGDGASDSPRTLFVVGDEKQSIFSFQRADPAKFLEMQRFFSEKVRASGQRWADIDMNVSFRSVQLVLDAVDHTFVRAETRAALGQRVQPHIAARTNHPGRIVLWPLLSSDKDKPDDNATRGEAPSSRLPVAVRESRSGSLKMAQKIGDEIKNILGSKTILSATGAPPTPGDIMVLVRRRNAFVNQLVRVLKRLHIPVSGVDRMVLGEQLAVQDLCAAARFALLPEDDLTLAGLLKSPLVGWTDNDLYPYAHTRTGSLWAALRADDHPACAWLSTLIEQAAQSEPYGFFSRVLHAPCPASPISGLSSIRGRLGEDAIDPLEEFLGQTLSYARSREGGLEAFLNWHEGNTRDIKREMEEKGQKVRIMTVHGAKGLQAPIVFLPDTLNGKNGKSTRIAWPHRSGLSLPVFMTDTQNLPASLHTVRQTLEKQEEDEYRRLLYVAMTRAQDHLYIGGYYNKRPPNEAALHWYNDIKDGLDALGVPSERVQLDGTDPDRIWEDPWIPEDTDSHFVPLEQTLDSKSLCPGWLDAPAPEEPRPPRPLVPSRLTLTQEQAEIPPARSPRRAKEDLYRFRRGTITHRLLQYLPDFAKDKRRTAAERYVARPALALPPALQESIVAETLAVLDHPDFADIFSPDALAEVPLSGLLADGRLVNGQVDRLLIRKWEILIVDYKTNRPPPTRTEDIPAAYRQQMETYAQLLRLIYPNHTIKAALIWTDGPALMPVLV